MALMSSGSSDPSRLSPSRSGEDSLCISHNDVGVPILVGQQNDSGYCTDSPASLNTGSLRFHFQHGGEEEQEKEEEEMEEEATGDQDLLDCEMAFTLNLSEEEEEDDDDVFTPSAVPFTSLGSESPETDVSVLKQSRTEVTPSREPQTGHLSIPNPSGPIDIPQSLVSHEPLISLAVTPPRHYMGELAGLMSPRGRGAHGWSMTSTDGSLFSFSSHMQQSAMMRRAAFLACRSNRPNSAGVTSRNRSRYFSDSTGEDDVIAAPLTEPPVRCMRDRSRSEPAIRAQIEQHFGRELRRISDEFHLTYHIISSSEGRPSARGTNGSSSYPGQGSHRGSWWQHIITMVAPRGIQTAPPSRIDNLEGHTVSQSVPLDSPLARNIDTVQGGSEQEEQTDLDNC